MKINWLNFLVLGSTVGIGGAAIYTLVPNVYGMLLGGLAGLLYGFWTAYIGILIFEFKD